MNAITYYNYKGLRAAATAPHASQQAIDDLGEWFEQFGSSSWNGEYFDADDGLRLARIETWDTENDIGTVTGYQFI